MPLPTKGGLWAAFLRLPRIQKFRSTDMTAKMPTVTPTPVLLTRYEGPGASYEALRLSTRHGTALLSLHGAQLLSWVPKGERNVFWMSPASLPEPAPIRGGVPVCWPWFAKQGQSPTAVQHGPVRNLRWTVSAVHEANDEAVCLSMVPALQATSLAGSQPLAEGVPPGLSVRMDLRLSADLTQSLHTENHTGAAFPLTEALHSYFAVSDAERIAIDGLQGLHYSDKLRNFAADVQREPFALQEACDRIYACPAAPSLSGQVWNHRQVIRDPAWQRTIKIETTGSRSVVVWNPGPQTARQMVDVPDDSWAGFFCVEATNAGADVVHLAPGQSHTLTQTLKVTRL